MGRTAFLAALLLAYVYWGVVKLASIPVLGDYCHCARKYYKEPVIPIKPAFVATITIPEEALRHK